MSNQRWIALHCGEESDSLVRNHPNAFLLLTQIAMRTKWKDCPITKLKSGQAFVGDWKNAGLRSEMAYRHAKKCLAECNLATFKGTSKGTVATLSNSMIFSYSTDPRNGQSNGRGTDEERTRNGRGTTNHTDTLIHGYTDTQKEVKSNSRGTIHELKSYAAEIGLAESDGEYMFEHWTANGWKNGSAPSRDWKAGIRKWKSQGWLPSQKQSVKQVGKHAGFTEMKFTGEEF